MKIGFIGCVDFSASALRSLEEHPDAEIVALVSRPASPGNSDFCSLIPWAQEHHVDYLSLATPDQAAIDQWFATRPVDVIYCLGWSFLLPDTLLRRPRLGVIGFHPAPLPRFRGRHPLIWALALGLTETASTFFFMDGGADSGDIVSQRPVAIGGDDTASDLYASVTRVALDQLRELTAALAGGRFDRHPQDHSRATVWRKRSAADGVIDWRMPASGVHNLVRALSRPYPGAECRVLGHMVKVWKTELAQGGEDGDEPGKVLSHDGGVVVKCGLGAIRLVHHELDTVPPVGGYLL